MVALLLMCLHLVFVSLLRVLDACFDELVENSQQLINIQVGQNSLELFLFLWDKILTEVVRYRFKWFLSDGKKVQIIFNTNFVSYMTRDCSILCQCPQKFILVNSEAFNKTPSIFMTNKPQ